VFASSIIVFIVTQGDDVIVGKMLGVAALAFYQMAYTFSNMAATEIIHVVSRVMLPAYSKLQDDLPKLKQAYLKVLQITAFVSAPLSGGIIALAPEFTEIFLGSKWMPAVPVMRILALSGLFRSIISSTSPVFVSIKRPDISVKCQIVRMSILAILIFPLTINWGILGVAYSVLFSTLVASILFSFRVIRITKIKIHEFSKLIMLPILNTIIFILLIEYFKSHVQLITIGQISLIILGVVASYFSIVFIFDRFFNYGMQRVIKEIVL
jgi:O-antigen/teichoic acid export membrane protein